MGLNVFLFVFFSVFYFLLTLSISGVFLFSLHSSAPPNVPISNLYCILVYSRRCSLENRYSHLACILFPELLLMSKANSEDLANVLTLLSVAMFSSGALAASIPEMELTFDSGHSTVPQAVPCRGEEHGWG